MRPRARILVVAFVLLAALDAERSLNARIGYARPVEVWQPDGPPAPDDCEVYTFFTTRSDQPGCR